jgi:ferredoxin-type protein NapH
MDVVLRRGRRYTWARRTCLAFSLLLTFGLPLWHLASLGAGTPPVVGPVGAVGLKGVELVDPLAVLGVVLRGGLSATLLLAALPGLLLVVVLGRFFCGWVCPYVPLLAASNAARWWLQRARVPLFDVKLPRRTSYAVLVAVLAGGALLGTHVWPWLYPPSVIGREVFHAVFFGGLTAGSLLLVFALAFDTFVSRAGFCRSLCPGGAVFSLLGAKSKVTIKLDAHKCTGCTACDVVCNLGQSPMTGRIDEGCERCGKCVASCPTDALKVGLRP